MWSLHIVQVKVLESHRAPASQVLDSYGFCSALVTYGKYSGSSDTRVIQQRMLTYLKKGISLKTTENLIIWVVGLTLLLTDLARKEANIYYVAMCTSVTIHFI